MKEEVEVDGAALCSSLQVCGLVRKRADPHGAKLSISQGNDAFAVTWAMGTELQLEEAASSNVLSS